MGFFTGARFGTITSLRVENLEQARPDPYMKGFVLIRVGPGTGVATKFDVAGDLAARHEPGVLGARDQIDGSAMFLLVVRLSPVDWILPPPHVCRAGLMAYSAATCIPCIGLCIFCTAKEIGLQE